MRKLFLLLALLMLVACAGGEEAQNEGEGLQIHGLLSYVEYGNNRAYIFGSMHLGRPYFFPLADAVEAAMRRSDAFAFEFDFTEMEDFATMMMVAQYMMLPPGQTLATYLPPHAYDHLVSVLPSFPNVHPLMLANMRPIAASSFFALDVFEELGISEDYSVDTYVFAFAQEHGKPVLGLNTLQHEMYLLFNAPHEVQVASIMALTDRDTMLAESYDFGLVEAYMHQDIEALTYLVTSIANYDDPYAIFMHQVILIQRSIEFAEEIDRLLRQTQTPTTFFITMGIGHMVGYDHGNVFVVLEEMGYTINPLWQPR